MNAPFNTRDVAYTLLATASAPFWARKARKDWRARFGHAETLPEPGPNGRLMIHAVSVGEVNALRTLVPLLLNRPDAPELVLSVGTDTGIERARTLFSEKATIVRYPVDFSRSVRRFLDAVKPSAVALVELELWPNFIDQCARRSVPVCVVNGRLSERSFRGYRKIRGFIGPSFAKLAFAAVQDGAYAERFTHMGVRANDVLLTGSMKWDAAPESHAQISQEARALAESFGIDRTRPLIVAGSTGPTEGAGEEALLHAACPPGAQLACAPRKPERFDEAARALSQSGPGCVRRSHDDKGPADRYLLDTIGELRALYELADLVVVGRSFGALHGSDPIEPVALGRPTLIGPAVGDFTSIVGAFEAGAGIVRTTRETLAADLARLLSDPAERETLARNGLAVVRAQRGASARHAELLMGLLREARTKTD